MFLFFSVKINQFDKLNPTYFEIKVVKLPSDKYIKN